MTRPTTCDAVRAARESRHVCWVVEDGDDRAALAAALLADATASGRKCVKLRPVDVATLAATVRDEAARARAEGHTGICALLDMDGVRATGEELAAAELLLDAVVKETDGIVVCAYTRATHAGAVRGLLCVHAGSVGAGEEAPFSLVAAEPGCWRLSGEVDLAAASAFAAAIAAALAEGTVLDATGLTFVDVAGLRALARAAAAAPQPVELRNATPAIRRWWSLGNFDRLAPNLTLSTPRATRRAS